MDIKEILAGDWVHVYYYENEESTPSITTNDCNE